jgi:hypothetical protein
VTAMIVCSPDDALHVPRELFEKWARTKFGKEAAILAISDESRPKDVTVQISRPGEASFQVFHSRKGTTISTDGTPEQAAEVALWVRSMLPQDPGGRIWLVDEGYNGHAELIPGMTVEELNAAWVRHSEASPEFGSDVGLEPK